MASADFDPNIVKPLIEAVGKAFRIQLSTEAKIVSLKPPQIAEKMDMAVTAVMSLASAGFNGTLALCFPAVTFLKLVSKMLGEKFEVIDKENADAAAEILNIIYGIARPVINGSGHNFGPAIPSVVRGENIKVSHPTAQIIGVMQCESDCGSFQLELSLKKIA